MPQKSLDLKKLFSSRLIIGFHATSPDDDSVKRLTDLLIQYELGGLIFFKYNITSHDQIKTLTSHFKNLPLSSPLYLSIDQEGGKVQRLNQENGHKNFYSAQHIGDNLTPQEALAHYLDMAQVTSKAGFNVSFGPVVDFSHHPVTREQSPVIGVLERAYGSSADQILPFALSYIKAHHKHHILTCLKHFPGHGLSKTDSHKGLTDVTQTALEDELTPFYRLIDLQKADMIMSAHLMNHTLDKTYPASLSRQTMQSLLREKGYQGLLITDDLMMGAIRQHYGIIESVRLAFHATNDLVILSDNPLASGIDVESGTHHIDHAFIKDLFVSLEKSLLNGELIESELIESYERIERSKSQLKVANIDQE